MAILPEACRSGIGAALYSRTKVDAHAQGFEVAMLQASGMGEPIYGCLGFRAICTITQYL